MLTLRLLPLACACALIAACGGGSDSSVPPAPPPAAAVPAPGVQLNPGLISINAETPQGEELAITLGGGWTGSNLGGSPVYLQLRDSANGLASETRLLQPAATLGAVSANTALAMGKYTGILELRACADAQCNSVYAGSTMSLPYTLNVGAVADWETHQRTAAHRGFVPFTLTPSSFAFAWKWQRPASGEPIGGINAVATAGQKVYVTTDVYHGEAALYALDEASGGEAWKRSLGVVPALAPPAVHKGRVYAATSGHEDTFLWAFDAATGNYIAKAPFAGQWPNLLAPTPSGSQVYTGAGYYGGVVYAFSTENLAPAWNYQSGGVWDMFTPAADAANLYHYSGLGLHVVDRATGQLSFSIADPFGKNADHSYHGAPVLGGRKNVLALSGGAFSGRAASSTEAYDQRVISSFSLEKKIFEWATGNAYQTAPAVAKGVIYAARNAPMSLDAIEEATGKVLWSWAPAGNGDTSFHRNVVATNNLVFVSTNRAVYAIDLATRSPVWSYPQPGMLAISAGGTLYIGTGATSSDGGLVAIRLK